MLLEKHFWGQQLKLHCVEGKHFLHVANLSDCFLRRVVQCKTTLQKWYSKVYFSFPTAVYGATDTFRITTELNFRAIPADNTFCIV